MTALRVCLWCCCCPLSFFHWEARPRHVFGQPFGDGCLRTRTALTHTAKTLLSFWKELTRVCKAYRQANQKPQGSQSCGNDITFDTKSKLLRTKTNRCILPLRKGRQQKYKGGRRGRVIPRARAVPTLLPPISLILSCESTLAFRRKKIVTPDFHCTKTLPLPRKVCNVYCRKRIRKTGSGTK